MLADEQCKNPLLIRVGGRLPKWTRDNIARAMQLLLKFTSDFGANGTIGKRNYDAIQPGTDEGDVREFTDLVGLAQPKYQEEMNDS